MRVKNSERRCFFECFKSKSFFPRFHQTQPGPVPFNCQPTRYLVRKPVKNAQTETSGFFGTQLFGGSKCPLQCRFGLASALN